MPTRKSTIKASELHRSPGRVLQRVVHSGQHLIVESDGQRVAVIVPYPDYEQLVREQAARNMKVVLANTGAGQISDKEVMADVLKAVGAVRSAKRRKKMV